ncbi:hypothetical protein HGM15179_020033 [Zosterops borbonicus]|uniref:Uncharacterized protein n=1 Tax=Zosterops borbonicus TaxID=364589 RepID=A0A8K1FXV4_9PASS|nr:hypothetical protein HGM15179_020033 [Zosterops borbonicus]
MGRAGRENHIVSFPLFIFHFLSIISCAMGMKRYVEANISLKSHTTVKYFMKMWSSEKLFIAATTVDILFTVFIQGMTIRPLIDLLAVKRKRESAPTMGEQIHIQFLDHLLAGIEDISGHWGQYYWKDKLEYFNSKYLQKILLREYNQSKSSIVLLYEKLEHKHAIELA